MRTKYATTGIVLARAPLAEASLLVTLLTPDLGLLRARVQGVRKPGAKLSAALQTFAESDIILVKGKEGWRLSGAVLGENHFTALAQSARVRAARIATLVLRLIHGESVDPAIYHTVKGLLHALSELSEEDADAAECLAALRTLRALGLDAGTVPGSEDTYDAAALGVIANDRRTFITRINTGIAHSGL